MIEAGERIAVTTLVEHTTRFVTILALPAGKNADAPPALMRRTLT